MQYIFTQTLLAQFLYRDWLVIPNVNKNNNKNIQAGNTKGGSITVPLTSCLTGLESN
jgi:hypothetical protein